MCVSIETDRSGAYRVDGGAVAAGCRRRPVGLCPRERAPVRDRPLDQRSALADCQDICGARPGNLVLRRPASLVSAHHWPQFRRDELLRAHPGRRGIRRPGLERTRRGGLSGWRTRGHCVSPKGTSSRLASTAPTTSSNSPASSKVSYPKGHSPYFRGAL